jgi:hypothetical protein
VTKVIQVADGVDDVALSALVHAGRRANEMDRIAR